MSPLAMVFSFRGRIRRVDFWLYSALVFAAMATAAGLTGLALGIDVADPANPRAILVQAGAILIFLWPNLAVCAKRLHDRGLSGWWILLSFLPVIGNAWLVINLGMMRGAEGVNRYGPPPARAQMTLIPAAA